jgi:hypothetical protein
MASSQLNETFKNTAYDFSLAAVPMVSCAMQFDERTGRLAEPLR